MFSDDPNEDLDIVAYIHDEIIDASGGATGFHDKKLVQSALARPLQTVGGVDAYDSVYKKAAALLDSIANNHGFRDGNKRTAMAAASYYLDMHDIAVTYTNEDYERYMVYVVTSKPSVDDIALWLTERCEEIPATRWRLINGRERAKQFPDMFHIPSDKEIARVKPGSIVKLGFEAIDSQDNMPAGERMWVIVGSRDGDNFVGELDNDPVVLRGLYYRDRISFSANNIIAIDD